MAQLNRGSGHCACEAATHETRLIVLTGGPGAGKTAVLQMAQRLLCEHVAILPEAAGIIFSGGFPRLSSALGRAAAQLAIYHVQDQVERLVIGERHFATGLCDRGTIDGLAYWPEAPATYWQQLGTTLEAEMARYAAVIHLRTPPPQLGYNNRNALRRESAKEAALIDERIWAAWSGHPHRHVIESATDFMEKARRAITLVREDLPSCCGSNRGVSTAGALP